jgi:hypothetical protein
MPLRNYRGVAVVLLPFSACSACAGRAGGIPRGGILRDFILDPRCPDQ